MIYTAPEIYCAHEWNRNAKSEAKSRKMSNLGARQPSGLSILFAGILGKALGVLPIVIAGYIFSETSIHVPAHTWGYRLICTHHLARYTETEY